MKGREMFFAENTVDSKLCLKIEKSKVGIVTVTFYDLLIIT
jgi:hypothetical protein